MHALKYIIISILLTFISVSSFAQDWIKIAESKNGNFYIQEKSGEVLTDGLGKASTVMVIGRSEDKATKKSEIFFWIVPIRSCIDGKGSLGIAELNGNIVGEYQYNINSGDIGSLIAGTICKAFLREYKNPSHIKTI